MLQLRRQKDWFRRWRRGVELKEKKKKAAIENGRDRLLKINCKPAWFRAGAPPGPFSKIYSPPHTAQLPRNITSVPPTIRYKIHRSNIKDRSYLKRIHKFEQWIWKILNLNWVWFFFFLWSSRSTHLTIANSTAQNHFSDKSDLLQITSINMFLFKMTIIILSWLKKYFE